MSIAVATPSAATCERRSLPADDIPIVIAWAAGATRSGRLDSAAGVFRFTDADGLGRAIPLDQVALCAPPEGR